MKFKNKYLCIGNKIVSDKNYINYFNDLISDKLSIESDFFEYDFNFGFRIKFKKTDIEYQIIIKDRDTNEILFINKFKPEKNVIYSFEKKYFINYIIEIFEVKNDVVIYPSLDSIVYSPENEHIRIYLSGSTPAGLGDSIAWLQGIVLFKNKFKKSIIDIICSYKEFNDLMKYFKFDNDITLQLYNYRHDVSYYATYLLGCFYKDKNNNYCPEKYTDISLIDFSAQILGVEFNKYSKSLLEFDINPYKNSSSKHYVCIGTHASSIGKEWIYENGWNNVIEFLYDHNYDIYCIDNEIIKSVKNILKTNLPDSKYIKYIPQQNLIQRCEMILGCDFFIGVSSGLSWLAWLMRKPVILISGFTNPKTEFYTPYRVFNKYVCNSCWNDIDVKWDPNKSFCPRTNNNIFDDNFLICSRSITHRHIISMIEKIPEFKNYVLQTDY